MKLFSWICIAVCAMLLFSLIFNLAYYIHIHERAHERICNYLGYTPTTTYDWRHLAGKTSCEVDESDDDTIDLLNSQVEIEETNTLPIIITMHTLAGLFLIVLFGILDELIAIRKKGHP